jgi:hypothetical protein
METPPASPTDMKLFRRGVMPAIPAPSIPELRARIASYRSDDLPEMVGAVREAEMACAVGLGDLSQQIRDERQEAGVQRGECDMSILIWAKAVERWDSRIVWLQNVRRYLGKEPQQHDDAGAPTP